MTNIQFEVLIGTMFLIGATISNDGLLMFFAIVWTLFAVIEFFLDRNKVK